MIRDREHVCVCKGPEQQKLLFCLFLWLNAWSHMHYFRKEKQTYVNALIYFFFFCKCSNVFVLSKWTLRTDRLELSYIIHTYHTYLRSTWTCCEICMVKYFTLTQNSQSLWFLFKWLDSFQWTVINVTAPLVLGVCSNF